MKPIPRESTAKSVAELRTPLTEEAAAQAMWLYYREHKMLLIADIGAYRSGILARLMAGDAVEEVFAPYLKAAQPTPATRRVP